MNKCQYCNDEGEHYIYAGDESVSMCESCYDNLICKK